MTAGGCFSVAQSSLYSAPDCIVGNLIASFCARERDPFVHTRPRQL